MIFYDMMIILNFIPSQCYNKQLICSGGQDSHDAYAWFIANFLYLMNILSDINIELGSTKSKWKKKERERR